MSKVLFFCLEPKQKGLTWWGDGAWGTGQGCLAKEVGILSWAEKPVRLSVLGSLGRCGVARHGAEEAIDGGWSVVKSQSYQWAGLSLIGLDIRKPLTGLLRRGDLSSDQRSLTVRWVWLELSGPNRINDQGREGLEQDCGYFAECELRNERS